jgi:hypothetical protein
VVDDDEGEREKEGGECMMVRCVYIHIETEAEAVGSDVCRLYMQKLLCPFHVSALSCLAPSL